MHVPGQALLAVHFVRQAAVTVLLSQRRTSPASETKPGKAPRDVEYVGGDSPHPCAQCTCQCTAQSHSSGALWGRGCWALLL